MLGAEDVLKLTAHCPSCGASIPWTALQVRLGDRDMPVVILPEDVVDAAIAVLGAVDQELDDLERACFVWEGYPLRGLRPSVAKVRRLALEVRRSLGGGRKDARDSAIVRVVMRELGRE